MKLLYLQRLIIILGLFVVPAGYASEIHEVELLIEAGATDLAMHVLDAEQAKKVKNPEHWLQWETLRIKLYKRNQNWLGLIIRLNQLPEWIPESFRVQALEEVARAQIELKDTAAALHTLRELIWTASTQEDTNLSARLPVWRQLVIEAYLVAENIIDAELAMLRYQQDYQSQSESWKRARATVLILAGKPGDAERLLDKQPHMHSRTIFYLARLLSGSATPAYVLKNTRRLANKKDFSDPTRRQFWLVAMRAAIQLDKIPDAIDALQQALMLLPRSQTLTQYEKLLFDPNVMDLWALYTRYGKQLVEKWKLAREDDTAMFVKASNRLPKHPIEALSLLSLLIQNSQKTNTLRAAHELFTKQLSRYPQSLQLLQNIYLHESMSNHLVYLPESVRLSFIDAALADSDMKTASQLIQTVNKPPAGEDVVYWKLRKSRILLLAGEHEKGTRLLRQLIEETPLFQVDQMDRLMQVLFDLQTIGQHREAIELFAALPMQGQSAQRQRELHYWMAESYGKIKEYQSSARHFLLSAGLFDSDSMDPWAQTARFHAAQMLVDDHAYQDAGRIYNKLLKVTKNEGRRAVIKNKIQQLWLQSNQFSGLRQMKAN